MDNKSVVGVTIKTESDAFNSRPDLVDGLCEEPTPLQKIFQLFSRITGQQGGFCHKGEKDFLSHLRNSEEDYFCKLVTGIENLLNL